MNRGNTSQAFRSERQLAPHMDQSGLTTTEVFRWIGREHAPSCKGANRGTPTVSGLIPQRSSLKANGFIFPRPFRSGRLKQPQVD